MSFCYDPKYPSNWHHHLWIAVFVFHHFTMIPCKKPIKEWLVRKGEVGINERFVFMQFSHFVKLKITPDVMMLRLKSVGFRQRTSKMFFEDRFYVKSFLSPSTKCYFLRNEERVGSKNVNSKWAWIFSQCVSIFTFCV